MVNQAAPWECVRLAAAFLTSTLLVQFHGIRSGNGCIQLFSALPPRPLRLSALSLFRHFFLPPRTAYHWHSPTGPSITSQRVSFLRYVLTSLLPYFLLPYLSQRSPRRLLHCSIHGSPTPRSTFPRRSSLARRDRARHPRFAALHRAAPARRSALLDRNWFRTRRDVPAPPRRRHSRPRHRNRPGVHRRPSPPRKTIPQSHRRPRRYSQSRPRRHRFRPPHPHLRQSALLHHFADPSPPLYLRGLHRRNTHRHSDRSRAPPRGPTRHARLRLSLRRHPVLFAARIRFRNSSRRIQSAAGSHLRPGHAPPARRTRKACPRRRIYFPGFCEIVFLAEAQNSGQ